MDCYTYGSAEGTAAVLERLPERYPMELNRSDMEMLVRALVAAWESDAGEVADWAGDFLSSIAQTVGVEFV